MQLEYEMPWRNKLAKLGDHQFLHQDKLLHRCLVPFSIYGNQLKAIQLQSMHGSYSVNILCDYKNLCYCYYGGKCKNMSKIL